MLQARALRWVSGLGAGLKLVQGAELQPGLRRWTQPSFRPWLPGSAYSAASPPLSPAPPLLHPWALRASPVPKRLRWSPLASSWALRPFGSSGGLGAPGVKRLGRAEGAVAGRSALCRQGLGVSRAQGRARGTTAAAGDSPGALPPGARVPASLRQAPGASLPIPTVPSQPQTLGDPEPPSSWSSRARRLSGRQKRENRPKLWRSRSLSLSKEDPQCPARPGGAVFKQSAPGRVS